MPARSHLLGDTGASSPAHWTGGLATRDLHAAVFIFARDEPELDARTSAIRARIAGIEEISCQDARRIPGRKEHFGYQEGISDVAVEGSGKEPLPGQKPAVKAGEFVVGYADENGEIAPAPRPEVLARNGSYLAYPIPGR